MLQLRIRQCWNFIQQPVFCSSSLCSFQNSQTMSKVFGTSLGFSVFFFWDMTACIMAKKNKFLCNFLPHSLFKLPTQKMGAADFPKQLQIYTRLHGLNPRIQYFAQLPPTGHLTLQYALCCIGILVITFGKLRISIRRFMQQLPFKCQYLFTKVTRCPTSTMRNPNVIKRGYF